MNMTKRSCEKELLDADDIPFGDIVLNMQELERVNTLLGGHKITCRGIDYFLRKVPPGKHLVIAEIGCGGGDNLTAIQQFMKKNNRSCTLIGIDIKQECIRYAQQNAITGTKWICSDYNKVTWQHEKPDIIFSALFCHHFTDEQLIEQLHWLQTNSGLGFFINDLHRHPLAYHSIKLLTKIFSRSYLVRNDAPLSVMRGFKRKDWVMLLDRAGITRYSIKWHWAFRYLICVSNAQQ
jgi:2-polyprenyl-3-methyl-5-hydroxy-6-metoxy-1,4-benzoquinol methylase